jgi:uncharacterized protein (DUF3084 family)
MKFIVFSFFLALIYSSLSAQSDTSAYTIQRNKINNLLAERSARFGQYDKSLKQRSGIFGLKTKKDMQASNDILTQIVLTDNDIFSELKILLDYKDFEKQEIQSRAETVEGRIGRFQTTIARLQQENERIKIQSEKKRSDSQAYKDLPVSIHYSVVRHGILSFPIEKIT